MDVSHNQKGCDVNFNKNDAVSFGYRVFAIKYALYF